MATRKEKLYFNLRRLRGFLRELVSDKRGALGVLILIFFSSVAIFAPFIAKHDPVNDTYLAGDYARPSWLRSLPGGSHLSENMLVVKDSSFDSINALAEWNITSTKKVGIFYSTTTGGPSSGPGSLVLEYKRQAGELAVPVEVQISKKFHYPYIDSPKRFVCNYSMLVKGISEIRELEVRVYITRLEKSGNATSYLLSSKKFSKSMTSWYVSAGIDSYGDVKKLFGMTKDPAKVIFNSTLSNMYTYDISLIIYDVDSSKNIDLYIYLDDLNLHLYGNCFGLLGTDQWGRDIFSQIVYGTRLSLIVGLLSAFLGVSIGLVVGVVSGYVGGGVDEILMRFTDMLLVLPSLPLLLVLIAVLGPSLMNLILLIGALGWMGFARVVRSQVLSLKERPFVEAAKAVGAGRFYIIFRHIVPNVISLVYVTLALNVPSAIISEAALSWLGLFDPSVVSWGKMLHDAMSYERSVDKWWWIVPPGLCIAILSLSFILIGYAIDDILNPKLRERR